MNNNSLFFKAINNDPRALMELGCLYMSGSEGDENKDRAVFLFGKAVENAIKKAKCSDTSEIETVVSFLRKYLSDDNNKSSVTVATENGMKDIFSSSKGINMKRAEVFKEEGTEHFENERYEDAAACFEKAVEYGDAESVKLLTETRLRLAYKAYYGTDGSSDFVKSEQYFREVAESGDERFCVEAKMCLAELYATRSDRPEDAVCIWKELAEKGNADAQYNYGLALFNGMGTEQNEESGVYWWQKAAKNGHKDAKYNIEVFFSDN